MTFLETERPARNRRSIHSVMPWDDDVEIALRSTLRTEKGVVIPLHIFHSSPAKGRLWKQGYSVRHRVKGANVVAWLEACTTKEK